MFLLLHVYITYFNCHKLRNYIYWSIHNIEPAQDKTYNKTCVISEYSDQSVHLRTLFSHRWSHVPYTASRLSTDG